MRRIVRSLLPVALVFAMGHPAAADEISDWSWHLVEASLVAPATNPLVMSRNAALVSAAVFDAINGIERRYTPAFVAPAAVPGASRRAAVVQAAYAILLHLYPAQAADLETKRAASLAGITADAATENSKSIARGLEWGQQVADAIWAWRLNDGFSTPLPPFTGGGADGQWRPTPPAMAPGAGVQFATMTPWVIPDASSFRPAGPPALTSAQYTADYNETKSIGRSDSPLRTADQTLYSQFWQVGTAGGIWDTLAISLATERHLVLSEKARLMAMLNMAMADAAIGCWDAKYYYVFWRPITAIRDADDGNPDTETDAAWSPLFATPAHPDYPSGHSCVSGAAGRVLAAYFGDDVPLSVENPAMLGVVREFASFTEALEEVKNARIYSGIHFRTACDDGQGIGVNVADFVLTHALQPVNGTHAGQVPN